MLVLIAILSSIAILAALIHLAALNHVRRVRQNPDPYPLALLNQEPDGEEVYLDRADGTRLRVRTCEGSGPTVVFVHGYGVTLLEWNLIWSLLSRAGYRLIAFDHRGHGQSTVGTAGVSSQAMADDIRAVLEHFDVTDGILVGHSMGGFLSIIFMLTHPKVATARLRHWVIMGSFAGDIYRNAPQTRLQIPLIEWGVMQQLVQRMTYGWLFGVSLAGERPAPSMLEVFRRLFAQTDHRRLLPILRAFAAENYYDRLGEIAVPCTVIYGLRDKTTPAFHSELIHQRIRGSQIVRVERVGHLFNWEAPEQIAAAIRSAADGAPTMSVLPGALIDARPWPQQSS
jgi:non-heme chloroperoxidase